MANENQIRKENMLGFLKHLSSDRTLVCPVNTGKVIEYREVAAIDIPADDSTQAGSIDQIAQDENLILMDDRIAYNSIKSFYFPQTELIFTFKSDEVIDNTELPGYVIFGAKPCDLEALRVMSIVYSTGKYADPFFQRRFEANLVIGVGCKNQKPECFCHEMGVDMEFSDFCDIMLNDNGESYSVEHLSEKGRQALKNYSTTSEVVCDNDRKAVKPCEDKLMLDTETDDAAYFDMIDWAKATETCKGCGICTYICPTCYCFDFKDVSKKGQAERYKCWDSCMYPKFTLHASGHNPREKRHERYRQRVLHKYKYVPDNFDGSVACTGCGRCIRSCPVGMNIRNIAKQVMEVQT